MGGYGSGYPHNKVTRASIVRALIGNGFNPKSALSLVRKGMDKVYDELNPSKAKTDTLRSKWKYIRNLVAEYKSAQDKKSQNENTKIVQYMSQNGYPYKGKFLIKHSEENIEEFETYFDAYHELKNRMQEGKGSWDKRVGGNPGNIGGKRGKPAWLKLKDFDYSDKRGYVEVVIEVNGQEYWYLLKEDDWSEFLSIADDSRGKAMVFLRSNAKDYAKVESATTIHYYNYQSQDQEEDEEDEDKTTSSDKKDRSQN